MAKLVTAAQMRSLEQAAVAAGATWQGLMEQAGQGVAREALRCLGSAPGKRVLVLVGPGNNGGDGLVAARELHAAGAQVQLYLWRRRQPEGDLNWQRCRERQIPELDAQDDQQHSRLNALLEQADLLIDALLGAGVGRPISGELRAMVELVNAMRARRQAGRPLILAVDLPTGLDTDHGTIWGTAIRADVTVATGLVKRGHRLGQGLAYSGRLVRVPIDLPAAEEEQIMTEELNLDRLGSLLPARPADSHKGTFGKVLVVAGAIFYPGAPVLAATAATRSGAGLVTLAVPRSIYTAVAAALHEATFLPLPEGEPGAVGESAAEVLQEHLPSYRAMLIGCGLGRDEATGRFLQRLLGIKVRQRRAVGFLAGHGEESADKPPQLPRLVVDADGLNLLAQIEEWHTHLVPEAAVLTPHPGEMARLLQVDELDQDPSTQVQQAAARWGQVVVLKGSTTIIAAPDGRLTLNPRPNPALATAGTGDVLAGLLAGLLAQGCAPYDAARLAVGVHSLAGERLRSELGSRGVVAGDLLARLPQVFRELDQQAQ